MQIPIFPNSSYLLAVGASPDQEKALREAGQGHRIRTFLCNDLKELQSVAASMARITGLIIFGQTLSNLILSAAKVPVRVLTAQSGPSEISKAVDDIIFELTTPGLETVLFNAVGQTFPSFIEKIPEIRPVSKVPFGFDHQLTFSLVANNVIGQGVLRFKLKSIEKMLEQSKQSSALEILQEAMNQCLGLVVQRMVKIGLNAKLGLPTMFDITSIPELQSLVFFPSVHLIDAESQIAFSLGFFDLTGSTLNFEGIADVPAAEEVEFL